MTENAEREFADQVQGIRGLHDNWAELSEEGGKGTFYGIPLVAFTKDDLLAIMVLAEDERRCLKEDSFASWASGGVL